MKKVWGLMLLCAMSMYLSSCSGCDSSDKDRKKSYKGQYHSPNGGRQTSYKGSLEQQRDLAEIDAYFNTHGWD